MLVCSHLCHILQDKKKTSENHLSAELSGRDGREYFLEGSKVTVFSDGQGHNGKVVRILEDPDKITWYRVNFDHGKDDKRVGF